MPSNAAVAWTRGSETARERRPNCLALLTAGNGVPRCNPAGEYVGASACALRWPMPRTIIVVPAMDDLTQIEALVHALATAIQAKDENALFSFLTPDFVLRQPGKGAVGANEFVSEVCSVQLELSFVRIEQLAIDLTGDSALVTGIQHSQVKMNGRTVEDRQPFIDSFVKRDGRWQLQVVLDLSEEP